MDAHPIVTGTQDANNIEMFPSSAVAECHRPGSTQPPLQQPPRVEQVDQNSDDPAALRAAVHKGKRQDAAATNATATDATCDAVGKETTKKEGVGKADEGDESGRKVR